MIWLNMGSTQHKVWDLNGENVTLRLISEYQYSNTSKDGHMVDSNVWKNIDDMYNDFSKEPWNIQPELAINWFNPFGSGNTCYNFWPVMCVVYNFPPNWCMKPLFSMLTLLIDSPWSPQKDIDIYLHWWMSDKIFGIQGWGH